MIAQKKYLLKLVRLKVQKCLNRFLDLGPSVNVVTQIYEQFVAARTIRLVQNFFVYLFKQFMASMYVANNKYLGKIIHLSIHC